MTDTTSNWIESLRRSWLLKLAWIIAPFGAFLALGLSFTLAIQALANMAVTVNLFPVTGVTLPLVSMGGTSFIFTCLAIGIILSVARNAELLEGKAAAEFAK